MKKILAVVLCLSLSMFALVGCGNDDKKQQTPAAPQTNQQQPADTDANTPADKDANVDADQDAEKPADQAGTDKPADDNSDKPADDTKAPAEK